MKLTRKPLRFWDAAYRMLRELNRKLPGSALLKLDRRQAPGNGKTTPSSSVLLQRPLLVELKITSAGKGKRFTTSRITRPDEEG